MNVAQPKRTYFYKPAHSYVNRPFQRKSAVRTQVRVSTVNRKFPIVNKKFPTGNSKLSTADMGNKGTAVKVSACWIWKPTQNLSNKGPNSNCVSVMFKKYTYIDTQGRLKSIMSLLMEDMCHLVKDDARLLAKEQSKPDEKGIVIRNKARLVAQGHTQEEGINYNEVFSPVARIEAIRLFLAYASFMGFTVYQMDAKSAFLYGPIDEEVYVMHPFEFQDPEFPARVYKVEKAMYGLHQDPRAWYGTLSKYLLTNSFPRAYSDSDYGGATQDRKSTTEGCQFLGRRFISWQCKKQTIMATSTTKAGYVATASGCGQVLWIQN
nr:putative ribonuclease H-like domain-containing protein [Tanacetum cinerariifolium]